MFVHVDSLEQLVTVVAESGRLLFIGEYVGLVGKLKVVDNTTLSINTHDYCI